MRTASPAKTHSPKDLCSIEQAELIARKVIDARAGYLIAAALEAERSKRWAVRLRRWWKAKLASWRMPDTAERTMPEKMRRSANRFAEIRHHAEPTEVTS